MKKTLLIPCVYKHISNLPNLKSILDISSVKPDEVLIDISSCPAGFKPYYLEELFSSDDYYFSCCITDEVRDAGKNRNNLAERSTGELLIFQDADDFFHPQRIELVEKSFLQQEVVHLVHSYHFNKFAFEELKFNKLQFNFDNLKPLHPYYEQIFNTSKSSDNMSYGSFEKTVNSDPYKYCIHNGAVSIKREVHKTVKWKTKNDKLTIAEDQDFNFECFRQFNKSFVLLEKPYYYNLNNRTNGGF
jgi:hypothetical protein